MDFLIKGDIIKVDTIKVLIDHEDESELPFELHNSHLKYSIHCSSFGQTGLMVERATRFKRRCGPWAYQLGITVEVLFGRKDFLYRVSSNEEQLVTNSKINLFIMNLPIVAKHHMNPFGYFNDGFMEIAYS